MGRRGGAAAALAAAAAVASIAAGGNMKGAAAAGVFVMPWMCLERCNDTAANITAQLQQFHVNSSVLTAASFEDYNLGPNSTLVKNNLTQVAGTLRSYGVRTYSMVSSYPYPPDFLYWMRAVFQNPQPFIDACIAAAAADSLTGWNIDWEPVSGAGAPTPTAQDAADYAAFLNTFSNAMHAAGLQASVDVATWSPIWNITAIAATSIDYIMTMNTYTDNWTSWQNQFNAMVATVPLSKLVIGLMTVTSTGAPFSTAALAQRFNAIAAAGITSIGIWRAGIPDNWWPFLDAM